MEINFVEARELVEKIEPLLWRVFPDHNSVFPEVNYLASLFAYLYQEKWIGK